MSIQTSSLLDLPDVVMKTILKRCDYPSIQVLRKTCHDLRNSIDDTKPDPCIKIIDVQVRHGSIDLILDFDENSKLYPEGKRICIGYQEGCLVKWYRGNEDVLETYIEEEDFKSIFCQDFEIASRFQKTVLQEFNVSLKSFDLDFMEIFENVLKSLPNPLQVKHFVMEMSSQEVIMSILPHICPKTLERIEISNIEDPLILSELDKIVSLDQWKQAHEVSVLGFYISEPAQNLGHFSSATISFPSVSLENMVLLKETVFNHFWIQFLKITSFLSSSTLNSLQLECKTTNYTSRHLSDAFGHPNFETDQFEDLKRSWFYRIPNTSQVLSIKYYMDIINFERIDLENIPQNVSIAY